MLGHDDGDLEGDSGLEEFGGGGDPREGISGGGVKRRLGVGGAERGRADLHRGKLMNGSAEAFLDITDTVAVAGERYHQHN